MEYFNSQLEPLWRIMHAKKAILKFCKNPWIRSAFCKCFCSLFLQQPIWSYDQRFESYHSCKAATCLYVYTDCSLRLNGSDSALVSKTKHHLPPTSSLPSSDCVIYWNERHLMTTFVIVCHTSGGLTMTTPMNMARSWRWRHLRSLLVVLCHEEKSKLKRFASVSASLNTLSSSPTCQCVLCNTLQILYNFQTNHWSDEYDIVQQSFN